jgi:molybdenum cofactor biosynthesis protein B
VSDHAGLHRHRQDAQACVSTLVVTVSDTRTAETDSGGDLADSLLADAGHRIVRREIVADDPAAIAAALRGGLDEDGVQAILFTGGTGVAPRDVTPDTVEPLLDRVIPGFGELFRTLSYAEIGSAALLSRALAGISRGRVVFVIPGSRGAVRLALDKLVVPEIGHLAAEAVKTR